MRSHEEADAAYRLGEQEPVRQRVLAEVRGAYAQLVHQRFRVQHLEQIVADAVVLVDKLFGLGSRLAALERRVEALERKANGSDD